MNWYYTTDKNSQFSFILALKLSIKNLDDYDSMIRLILSLDELLTDEQKLKLLKKYNFSWKGKQ